MGIRVSRARAVVAQGCQPAVVARVACISRQAIYWRRRRRPREAGPGQASASERAIIEVAKENHSRAPRAAADPPHGQTAGDRISSKSRGPEALWQMGMTKV